jgi:mRNA interferase MazF
MVKQGDIIKLYLGSVRGHEQDGYRPALVVSNDDYNALTNLVLVCPITHSDTDWAFNIALEKPAKTEGFIMCNHIKAVDLSTREFQRIESASPATIAAVSEMLRALVSLS